MGWIQKPLLEGAIRTATRRGMHVVVWASTPCTGGSPWQHLQVARDESYYSRHLKGLFTVHRKLWKSFLFLVNVSKQPTWVIEWPQRCAYWGWASTKSFLRTNSHSEGLVFGCSCGLEYAAALEPCRLPQRCSHMLLGILMPRNAQLMKNSSSHRSCIVSPFRHCSLKVEQVFSNFLQVLRTPSPIRSRRNLLTH